MGILDIPWYERPGARLSREGVESLTNSDLLSVLIGKGKKESVMDLSNRIISKHKLNGLYKLGIEELTKECKGDQVPALKILSFIELSKRYSKLVKGGYNKKPISSAKDVYNMFYDKFKNYKKEVLSVLLLDTKKFLLSWKKFKADWNKGLFFFKGRTPDDKWTEEGWNEK